MNESIDLELLGFPFSRRSTRQCLSADVLYPRTVHGLSRLKLSSYLYLSADGRHPISVALVVVSECSSSNSSPRLVPWSTGRDARTPQLHTAGYDSSPRCRKLPVSPAPYLPPAIRLGQAILHIKLVI